MIENNILAILDYIHQYDSEFRKLDHKVVPENIDELFRDSILLQPYEGFSLEDFVMLSISEEAYIFVVRVLYRINSGRVTEVLSEFQFFGVKMLDSNYGKLFIRPETFGDKVSDLFVHQDHDFRNYPKFSSKYFFISDHPGNAEMFAKANRLILMEQFDDLLLEVSGNTMISKFAKPCNEKDFMSMIQLLKGI
jgi:hypothetical protein